MKNEKVLRETHKTEIFTLAIGLAHQALSNQSLSITGKNCWNIYNVHVKAAKYEIQKPSTCCATLFCCKFLSMILIFHLARST